MASWFPPLELWGTFWFEVGWSFFILSGGSPHGGLAKIGCEGGTEL